MVSTICGHGRIWVNDPILGSCHATLFGLGYCAKPPEPPAQKPWEARDIVDKINDFVGWD